MVVRARPEAALSAERGTRWQPVCTRDAALPLHKARGAKRYWLRCAALAEQHTPRVVRLQAELATPASFSPYGQARRSSGCFRVSSACVRADFNWRPGLQVIGPTNDGKEFDKEDALLQLDQGRPRCARQHLGAAEAAASYCC